MVRVILCDDDNVFLSKIAKLVKENMDALGICTKVYTFDRIEKMMQSIISSCDIAILDVDFGQERYNGLDVARKIREARKDAVIIFVTNFVEYAPEGYEVQAFRYILKNDIPRKLADCLKQAISRLNAEAESLRIKMQGDIYDISLSSILYIESQLRMVKLYVMNDGEVQSFTYYASLAELEHQLEPQGFLRIHKSYLVNMKYLRKFHCGTAVLENGTVLKVSERRYAQQKEKFLLWKGVK